MRSGSNSDAVHDLPWWIQALFVPTPAAIRGLCCGPVDPEWRLAATPESSWSSAGDPDGRVARCGSGQHTSVIDVTPHHEHCPLMPGMRPAEPTPTTGGCRFRVRARAIQRHEADSGR